MADIENDIENKTYSLTDNYTMGTQDNHGGKFQIDDNVPLPPKRRASALQDNWPFADMSPGQSFQVVGKELANRARNAASSYASAHPGVFFVSRTMGVDPDSGEDVVRIFRVASKNGR